MGPIFPVFVPGTVPDLHKLMLARSPCGGIQLRSRGGAGGIEKRSAGGGRLGFQTWATLWDDYSLPPILYFDCGGVPGPPASFGQQLCDDWGMDPFGWKFRNTLIYSIYFLISAGISN